jgi:hypothetical protein
MKTYQSKKFCIGITSTGIAVPLVMIIYYPLFLPRIISYENAAWIDQISYIFYAVLFGSIIFTAFNIHKVFQMLNHRINKSFASSSSPYSIRQLSLIRSLFEIIISILNDKKYFKFFWPASIGYGIFYALVSSMIILRLENSISSLYGVTVPSITMISYGPMGYVPTIAAYLTEHTGLLIIPINLIVTLVISALVGFNTVLSVYAFAERPKRSVNTTARGTTSSILSVIGATTSLFAVCPTCASFYIFNIMAGSLAPTIAAFAVSYYALFVVVSIPLLVATLFVTAFSVHRMMIVGQCYLK